MIVSDNALLIHAAIKNYDVFKVPANRVKADRSVRYYTNADKADLDYKTSENKIGKIVNLSQELNSIMWDRINRSQKPLSQCYDDIREIYHDICILNVLSSIEIDKAKKEFQVSVSFELSKIKAKWLKKTEHDKSVKPAFLGFIAKNKGYYDPGKKSYEFHETTMDYVLKLLNKYRSKKTKAFAFLPFCECFLLSDYQKSSVNWKQLKSIVDLCQKTKASTSALWCKEYYTPEERNDLISSYKEEMVTEMQRMKINQHTMYVLLSYIDMPKYSQISKLLFYALFHYRFEALTSLLRKIQSPSSLLAEAKDGELELYGMKFKRIRRCPHEQN